MKKSTTLPSALFVAALVAIDQFIKLLIVKNYAVAVNSQRSYFTFRIGSFKIFSLTHIRNNGAGWSILGGKTVFLIVFTVIILAAILVYAVVRRKKITTLEQISLCMIVAGGVGNLIDRCRMLIEGTDVFSGVIDYIRLDFMNFPVFNFADCCVTFGALLFCIYVVADEVKASKKPKKPTEEPETADE